MPKSTVADWSATANDNTDVGGINIDSTGSVNQGDNAMREIMAQVKTAVSANALMAAYTPASASAAASLDFHEDTDNGTNRVRLTSAASIASNRTVTFPDADLTINAFAANFLDDATAAAVRDTLSAFGVVRVQVFTSSGTYTPHADMLYCIIECVGGGGGGGGVDGDAVQLLISSGGGAGSYSRKISTAADIGASQTVTIGAAGAGGVAGNNAGGNGGDTSVGALCIGKGGTGGSGATTSSVQAGGAGGVAGTGDVTGVGANGAGGMVGIYNPASVAITPLMAGTGAASAFGAGGNSVFDNNGLAGAGRGSGGSGGMTNFAATNRSGGAGTAGLVIVTEFCSQ